MKNISKNMLLSWVLISMSYFAVIADYSTLTKNTWDTLTATNWNQLVENVKWIQTDSDLNVGIWTTSPTSLIGAPKLGILGWNEEDVKIYVQSQWNAPSTVWVSTTDWTNLLAIQAFPDSDSESVYGLLRSWMTRLTSFWENFVIASTSPIQFITNWTEKLRISEDWNIWIGITDPDTKLEVNGNIKIWPWDYDIYWDDYSIALGKWAAIWTGSSASFNNEAYLTHNTYWENTWWWKYRESDVWAWANLLNFAWWRFIFKVAPDWTKGQSIAWNTAIQVTDSGKVWIGWTEPIVPLQVEWQVRSIKTSTTDDAIIQSVQFQPGWAWAWMRSYVQDAASGDPYFKAVVNWETERAWWIDNSDDDNFKISRSGLIGSSDKLVINSAGNLKINALAWSWDSYACIDASWTIYRSTTACN